MKISARNALPGTVVSVTKGATTAHVVIDVNGIKVTASITNEADDDLGLKNPFREPPARPGPFARFSDAIPAKSPRCRPRECGRRVNARVSAAKKM